VITKVEKKIVVFQSYIYLYKNLEKKIEVYKYLVESCYVFKNNKELELVKEFHLRECFRLNKYLNTDIFDFRKAILVKVLNKEDENFKQQIFFQYL
jgi:hypothetical protein